MGMKTAGLIMKRSLLVVVCVMLIVPEVRGQVLTTTGQAGPRDQRSEVRAATGTQPTRGTKPKGKKILFTVLGAAAGFGAGVYFGLKYFDDALYSDRKVWTCVAIGTAAGAIAGWVLAPDRAPAMPFSPTDRSLGGGDEQWDRLSIRRTDSDRALALRIREVSRE